ncbi:hypothetical protein N2152v2_000120 [Parachlorella kessleri]
MAAPTLRLRHFIDSHKLLTGPFVLLLMAVYGAWGLPAAWVYLAMHGTYGLLWIMKGRMFGDKNWENPCGWGYGLGRIYPLLTLYWVAPWVITRNHVAPPPWWIAACVSLWGFGVFFHFAGDMQKWAYLKLRPGKLINDGLWARCRNPNYFGELLIYLGFNLLTMHWLPLACVSIVVIGLWIPNMRRKDKSLSRYPEFAAYKAQSTLFIPYLW